MERGRRAFRHRRSQYLPVRLGGFDEAAERRLAFGDSQHIRGRGERLLRPLKLVESLAESSSSLQVVSLLEQLPRRRTLGVCDLSCTSRGPQNRCCNDDGGQQGDQSLGKHLGFVGAVNIPGRTMTLLDAVSHGERTSMRRPTARSVEWGLWRAKRWVSGDCTRASWGNISLQTRQVAAREVPPAQGSARPANWKLGVPPMFSRPRY
jgi:hypothetical protein